MNSSSLFKQLKPSPGRCIRGMLLVTFALQASLFMCCELHAAPDGVSRAKDLNSNIEPEPPNDTGEHEESIRRAREQLAEDPSSYEARYQLARALAFSEQYDQAIQQYTRLLEEHPGDPDALLGRGRVYAWRGEYEKAESDLRRVTSSSPDYADAWRALGDVYYWSDRPRKALEAYNAWKRLEPENHEVYLSLAKVNEALERQEKVSSLLKKSEQLGASTEEVEGVHETPDESDQAYRWELRQTYEHTLFTSRFADWRVHRTELFRSFDGGAIGGVFERQDRFREIDSRAGFDVYHDLWSSAYGNLRYLYGFDADVSPENDVLARLYQDIGHDFILIPGYRHMDFTSESVNIYSLGVGKYVGRFYGEVEAQWVPEDREPSYTYLASLRYTWSEGEFVEVEGTVGDKTVTLSNNRVLRGRSSWSASIRVEKLLTDRYGVFGGFQYADEEDVPIRRTGHIGLFYRW